jgi:hypothetical protein
MMVLCTPLTLAGSGTYTIKTTTKAPPKALAAPIQELLSDQVVELYKDGKLAAEVWFCKTIPGQVAADLANKNVTYKDLKQTSLLGAVHLHTNWGDYRKQNIKPGVYTLRLAFQPQDGDHMGTAPFPEFLLLTAAKTDTKADIMPIKSLVEASAASINTAHPAVLLLYPNQNPGGGVELSDKGNNTWVLNLKKSVATEKKGQATLGISLAIVGHTAE